MLRATCIQPEHAHLRAWPPPLHRMPASRLPATTGPVQKHRTIRRPAVRGVTVWWAGPREPCACKTWQHVTKTATCLLAATCLVLCKLWPVHRVWQRRAQPLVTHRQHLLLRPKGLLQDSIDNHAIQWPSGGKEQSAWRTGGDGVRLPWPLAAVTARSCVAVRELILGADAPPSTQRPPR